MEMSRWWRPVLAVPAAAPLLPAAGVAAAGQREPAFEVSNTVCQRRRHE